jgi:prepilin-type N-terminal cleavage/methylation domain-containing protein
MRTLTKQTKAFTMVELVFVIVVLGILAALALPRMERDLRQEAADNILSSIRYTQHLALNDDKTDPFNPNWQQELWAIRFTNAVSGNYYTVSSDINKDGLVDKTETAIEPINGKYMYHLHTNPIQDNESTNILIGKKYGIDSIGFNGGCSSQHIAFDQLGRPHNGIASATNNYDKYMTDDCNMTFGFIDPLSPLIITIKKETGYAYIVGQEDS